MRLRISPDDSPIMFWSSFVRLLRTSAELHWSVSGRAWLPKKLLRREGNCLSDTIISAMPINQEDFRERPTKSKEAAFVQLHR